MQAFAMTRVTPDANIDKDLNKQLQHGVALSTDGIASPIDHLTYLIQFLTAPVSPGFFYEVSDAFLQLL